MATATKARSKKGRPKSQRSKQGTTTTRVGRRALTALLQPTNDPIRHVVLLMLENRSFDHAVGALQTTIPELDGVVTGDAPRSNESSNKLLIMQEPNASVIVSPDPMHETRPNVMRQLEGGNKGFVHDYEESYKGQAVDVNQIMAYHDVGVLPALQRLAQEFTICDRWFCSVPGPTWTNRLFALSGTSLGRVQMPEGIFQPNVHYYNQTTIFDRLRERGLRSRIYYGDFPLSLLFTHQWGHMLSDYSQFSYLDSDVDDGEAAFPEFVLIEPSYLEDADDDHPPHDVRAGEHLIASVYNSIRRKPDLWQSTLLIVAFDEHGGFYDHVEPPAATPPDDYTTEYTFDRYGLRVPAILVSPWAARRVEKTLFDHTSLLRYVIDKWGLGELGSRTLAAESIGQALRTNGQMRDDTPESIDFRAPTAAMVAAAPQRTVLNGNQKAIVSFSQYLEKHIDAPATAKLARSVKLMDGPDEQLRVAEERAARFISQGGGRTQGRRAASAPFEIRSITARDRMLRASAEEGAMALSRKRARDRICIAVASQLKGVTIFALLNRRDGGDEVSYESLGLDEEGRESLVRPLNVVFEGIDSESGEAIRWGIGEVRGLVSIEATETLAIEKSKA